MLRQRLDDQEPEHKADREPEQRAERRHDERLAADHPPQLDAAHPDRAQQPDLARSLVDRQRQRVHDADQRDDHREQQQHVHQPEDLVELRQLAVDELGLVVGLDAADAVDNLVDDLRRLCFVDTSSGLMTPT